MSSGVSRRALLVGTGVGAAALVAGGAVLERRGDGELPGPVPEAPVGDERVERRRSEARGKHVDFYTAVPAGHGDGEGLPVVLILHGASATAAEYDDFGFGRFLTDAVQRGAKPFVLAGATGGVLRWEPSGSDDPRSMVHEELPAWCKERGFDTSRIALWGWSSLESALPEPKAAGSYAAGRHTRRYWNRCTPAASDFLAAQLARCQKWRSRNCSRAPGVVTGDPGGCAMTTKTMHGEYVPSAAGWVRNQVEAYERSGGREANTLRDTGLPVIIVTMRGNKSGTIRKIALMRVEHDGEYALIGSYGGSPKHPVWVHNLRANPDEVSIQDGPEPFAFRVREVTGDERAAWWERGVAAFPPYADYQQKTDREIPVFVASRASTR